MVLIRVVLACSAVLILSMTGMITLGRIGADDEPYFILFNSTINQSRGVYRINPDGSDLTQIANTSYRSRWMMWASVDETSSPSPDGQWIVFSSERTGNYDLYVKRADGSDERQLLVTPEIEAFPKWSPDGTRIMFIRYLTTEAITLYDIAIDGTDERRLSYARFPFTDGALYSPDGNWIVFTSGFDGVYDLYRIPADGSDQGNEVVRLTEQGYTDHSPDFSPDGRWIAFVSDRDGNPEIYRMRVDGTDVQRLTNNNFNDQYPKWSPSYERAWQPGITLMFSTGMIGLAAWSGVRKPTTESKKPRKRGFIWSR